MKVERENEAGRNPTLLWVNTDIWRTIIMDADERGVACY